MIFMEILRPGLFLSHLFIHLEKAASPTSENNDTIDLVEDEEKTNSTNHISAGDTESKVHVYHSLK